MKPKGFILFSRSHSPSFRHSHKSFNGFGHYDYVCEISPKNSMFFGQLGIISSKYMENKGPKY
jgi:hypothetical protein